MWDRCHCQDVPVGSKWRERKPYQFRVVEVVGFDVETQKVLIKCGNRITKAKPSRFGKDYHREPD